ncbi:VPS10 domain-containing protein [Flavilitoribacter nigricans]|uniref:Glycosyl hydrolase n=1 Tax=Flavilitoribacter nigricans (strain ATCC 23147 / DSM 23189 / NBRC 102662 / NCIMB 1420 / SS-2) TaxID=1122177 RepID=A0A2D0N414_FLAN2|nr:glycosyl hydrolase [Flavilitoribacter nigricans]PHN03261.1 glycosyl hydrolase [Flavilitoribacter nigricans DSM 23189 = NBRC 102662]
MKIQLYLVLFLVCTGFALQAQKDDASVLSESHFSGLKMRNIGPSFTSGRIADIAIHPEDDNLWYVAVGSGGVWKTENAGVTWESIFDGQNSYSIGCVTIDPNNPSVVWVGTGENVGGRHVGFGDGLYRSPDAGRTWKKMGLETSEHISRIIVHPEDSDIVWVAAQGPLWSKGGDRGLYKTTDGGKSWKKTLGDEEWTGVTDIVIDPRDPDVLYAATWQRHRTVAAFMGGGPGSGIYRSTDGGEQWEKLSTGLPRSNMGKIGLAISPQQPDVVYAVIELDRTTGGLYRSSDRGASWEKRSSAVSGATGPHYYQELYASPHQEGRLYLMDNRVQVSDDGGRSFSRLSESGKHSDNHALAFRPDDPDYLLIGTDGGLYESFDLADNWRFIDNMPITQYYKVAVDDAEPFYHVYGGTQDNGSHGGPSRTDTEHGIRNADWYKTLGADGHQSATEPGNPNIMYAETQQGGLHRVDRLTGEQIYIQPQPDAGEDTERFNWDAPILVSPHEPSRIYFASNRVWKSEDRGDSWTAISGDLTRNQDRVHLPIMGQTWGWDAAWDMKAMSNYNTITSLAESPLQEGLIYAGTDDGRVQVTEDGGANWRLIEAGKMPGVPETAFVNDIKADLHDVNTVYVSLDNHKYGDFKPYLMKSTDRGKSWKSISANIPDRHLVWRMVQDHVDPNLLFAATEFGIFFTLDAGEKWMKLNNGSPNIAFRDLTIQKRENDLVGASFGRGFFILDDYSVLREISEEKLAQAGALFPIRDALWYVPRSVVSSQGAGKYAADNPPFGAVFTYHLKESLSTLKSEREKAARTAAREGKDVTFPAWKDLAAENRQESPKVWLTVKDSDGNVVRKIEGATTKGIHRTAWDLTYPSRRAVSTDGRPESSWRSRGMMAVPGQYTVTLSQQVDGEVTVLAGPETFDVVPLRDGALEGSSPAELTAFREQLEMLQMQVSAASNIMEESMNKVQAMQTALERTSVEPGKLDGQLFQLKQNLLDLEEKMYGNPAKEEIGESNPPTVQSRLSVASRGMRSTYGLTPTHVKSMEIAREQLKEIKSALETIHTEEIPKMEKALQAAGAPWIEGQALPKN